MRRSWLENSLKMLAGLAIVFSVYVSEKADYEEEQRIQEEQKSLFVKRPDRIVENLQQARVKTGSIDASIRLPAGIHPVLPASVEGSDFSPLARSIAEAPVFLTEDEEVLLLIQFPGELDADVDRVQFKTLTWRETGLEIRGDMVHEERPDATGGHSGRQPVALVSLGQINPGPYEITLSLRSVWTQRDAQGKTVVLPAPEQKRKLVPRMKATIFVNYGRLRRWGAATNGLQAKLLLVKDRIECGQPVTVRVDLRNISGKPVPILVARKLFTDFWPQIVTESGRSVAVVPTGTFGVFDQAERMVIEPGDMKSFLFQLNTHEGFAHGELQAGRYGLAILYGVSSEIAGRFGGSDCWSGVVGTPRTGIDAVARGQ